MRRTKARGKTRRDDWKESRVILWDDYQLEILAEIRRKVGGTCRHFIERGELLLSLNIEVAKADWDPQLIPMSYANYKRYLRVARSARIRKYADIMPNALTACILVDRLTEDRFQFGLDIGFFCPRRSYWDIEIFGRFQAQSQGTDVHADP